MTSLYCTANLNFAVADDMYGVDACSVAIEDGRNQTLSWETNGFELRHDPCAVEDWEDPDALTSYYDHISELAESLTGCDHALLSNHIVRSPKAAAVHQDYAPIQYAHSDFTDNYGEIIKQRYQAHPEEFQHGLARSGLTAEDVVAASRLMILQFWRNVGDPYPDTPLALCDAQTVPRDDLIEFHVPNYADGDFAFNTFGVRANPDRQAWFTFPGMDHNEVLLIRTFDSARVGTSAPYWTPHSAFTDPKHATTPRHSIEARATCIWLN